MTAFPKADVPVTLTGEEWTTVLAKLAGRPLSKIGAGIWKSAATKMQAQILAASNAAKGGDVTLVLDE